MFVKYYPPKKTYRNKYENVILLLTQSSYLYEVINLDIL